MPEIIAMGGGGFLREDIPLRDAFILSCTRGSASRVCFMTTASERRGRAAGSACHDGVEAECGDDTGRLSAADARNTRAGWWSD